MLAGCLLFGLVLLCLGLTGCGKDNHNAPSTQGSSSEFRLNLGTEPPSLDPMKATDLTSFTVIQNLMKGLTQFGPNMQIQPAVAQRWTISKDRLTYTFYLNPTARWHDGQSVTAQQFVDAWQRALTPANAADYAFFLQEIAGAEAFAQSAESEKPDPTLLQSKALNAYTLQVRLTRPIPFFLAMLASPVALPIRKNLIAQHGDTWTEAGHFIGNGPYQLAKWQHDDVLVLTPNPHYRLNNTAPPTVTVRMVMVNDPNTSVVMYENNELDFIETTTSIPASDVRRLRHHTDARMGDLYRLNYVGFNIHQPPVDDVRVRQALTLAIDRTWIPQLMQSGQKPNASWITDNLFGYTDRIGLEFDPVRAKQLLANAGYPDGKGFPEITLAYNTQPETRKEMEILQDQWRRVLGIRVRLANMEWKTFLKQLKSNPPAMYRVGWFADYPDADSFLNLFISASGNNYSGWKHPQYDALVAQAAVTANGPKRQALMDRAQWLLLEHDTVIAPLYATEKLWLAKPYVKGLVLSPLNLIDLQHLRIARNEPDQSGSTKPATR